MTERMTLISNTMKLAIATNGGISLDSINPTAKELLKLASQEPPLTVNVSICGIACEGLCNTCTAYTQNLDDFYSGDEWKQQPEEEQPEEEQPEEEHCDCFECRGNMIAERWDYGDDDYDDYETGLDWNESGYFD